MQPVPDPYRVLGIVHSATIAQVKAAHRALAKRYHPDAPEGDTARFLAVQNAYLLLSDPARRRQWDAAHAPGPVRAGEGPSRGRARGAAGRWTREEPDAGIRRGARGGARRRPPAPGAPGGRATGAPGSAARGPRSTDPSAEPHPDDPQEDLRPGTGSWSASGRDPASRSHTWSAQGVPWWEDFPGPRDRKGRAGRSDAPPGAGFGPRPARRGAPGRTGGEEADPRDAARAGPPGSSPADLPQGQPPAHEPDVYSRSSGAAWSSAARRYFRRSDSELPSRGSFRKQGTQYVTGARAREMADGDWTAAPSAADDRAERILRPHPGRPPARQAFEHEPAPVRAMPPTQPPRRPAPGLRASPAVPRAGGIAEQPTSRFARWSPTASRRHRADPAEIAQRVAQVALAWLPVVALAGWGAPAAMGCGSVAESCPEVLLPAQAIVAAVGLAAFVAFPSLARIGASATLGGLTVAIFLLLILVSVGLLPPAPPIVAGVAVLVGVGYLAAGSLAAAWMWRDRRAADHRSPRTP